MMENSANTSYTFGMATGEILILLLLAFLAGMLLCWLLRKMGICCTRKRDIPSTGVPVNTLTTETMGNYQVSPSAFDRRVGNLTATGANVAEKAERMPVRESVKVDPIKTPEPPTIKVEHDIIKPVIVPPVVPITEVDVQPSPKEIPLKDISLPEAPTLDLTANKPAVVDVNTIEPISHSTKGLDAEAELPQFPSDLAFPEHTVKASAPPEITVEEVQDPVEAESKSFFDSLLATHLRSLSGQEPSPAVHLEKPDLTPSTSVQPLSAPELPTAKTTHLSDIDPHRPIIDGPDDVVVAGEGNDWMDKAKIAVAGTAAAAAAVIGSTIDPHKPIVDDPEDEGFFSTALKKLQDTAEKVSDKVETWVEGAQENDTPVADTLEEQADNATAKAEDAAEAVAATAQDVKEAVTDKASELGDKAEAVVDQVNDKLSDAKAATQDTVDELVEDAQSTGNKLAEKASDTLEAAKDKLQDAKEAVTDAAHEASDKLAATVEDIDPHRPIVDESDEDKPGFFGSLLHKVQDAAERVSDKVEGWVDHTQQASDEVVDKAKDATATTDATLDQPVEKTPSTTAAVLGTAAAAASAVVLGSIDPHRPIEDDPEEEKPGFFNQALHQLQDAAGRVSDKVEGWVDTAKEKAANLTEPSAETDIVDEAKAAGDKLADEAQDLKEAVADKAADVVDDAQSAGDKLADKVQDVKEAVADNAADVVDDVQSASDKLADKAQDLKEAAADKAADVVDDVKSAGDKLADKAQDIKEAVADKASDVADKVKAASEVVADTAETTVDTVKDHVQDTQDAISETTEALTDEVAANTPVTTLDGIDPHRPIVEDSEEETGFFGSLLTKLQDTAEQVSDKVSGWVDNTTDKADALTQEAQEATQQAEEKLQETNENLKEAVTDKAADLADGAKDLGDEVADKASDNLNTIEAKVQDLTATTVEAAPDKADEDTAVNPEAIIPKGTISTDPAVAASLLASTIDPHQPIINDPEDEVTTSSKNEADTPKQLGSEFAHEIDPHRPIVDESDEDKPGFFGSLLHKVQDAAERVSDKVEGWVDNTQSASDDVVDQAKESAATTDAALDQPVEKTPSTTATVLGTAAAAAASAVALGSIDPHRPIEDDPEEEKPGFFNQALHQLQDAAGRVSDKVEGWVDTAKEKAANLTEPSADTSLVEDAQAAGDTVVDKAQDLKEAAADKAADVVDNVQAAGEKLADKAQDVKEAVADKASDVADDIQSAGDKLADKAQDLKEAVADKTADVADEVKVAGEAVAETTVDTVKDHAQDTQDAISESTKALTAEVATDTPVTTLDGIDPHRPIVEDPEEETGFFGSLFTKLHDAAERVSDKVGGLVNDVAEKADDATDKAEKTDQEASAENSSVLGTTAAILGTTAAISATALSAGTQSSSTEDHADSQQPSATTETAPESAPSSSPDPALVSVTHYKPAKTAEELKDSGETIAEQTSAVVDDAKDSIAAKASDLSDTAETATTDLTATASDVTDTLQESIHETSDTIAEKTQDLADQAKEVDSAIADKASDVIESIQDKTQQAKDTVADKAAELSDNVKALGESVADKTDATLDAVKAKVEDVQEAVADKASDTLATVNELTADKPQGSATADYDPHKPIVDEPEAELALSTSLDSGLLTQEPTTSLDYDPHKPIEDEPEDAPQPTSNGGFFSGLLHNAVEGVSHLGEKVDQLLGDKAPAAHDLLQKAKDQVEHLGAKVDHLSEKATPVAQDWAHKAKDTVDHLVEKAPPSAQELVHKAKDTVEHLGEKAAPVAKSWLQRAVEKVEQLSENAPASTQEWLHKAKDTLEHLGEKLDQHTPDASTTTTETKAPESASTSTSPLQAESLVKSSATLNELATSTQELTEKLMNNMSAGQSDFQRIYGIDATIAQALQADGIVSYRQLADALPKRIHSLLEQLGGQYVGRNISSWFVQANLAAQDEWNILEAYQRELKKNDNAV